MMTTALVAATGCTHHSLTRNTVQTTSTVMDIHYRSVLANLAMMSCHLEALPNHVNLADGVVQINDRIGLGQAGGFTTFGGSDFGIEQFGPSGQRQVTEQWGTDATTDPERLYDLQSLYRAALALPPLPPSNAVAYIRSALAKKNKQESEMSGDDSSESTSDDSSDDSPSPTSTGGGGSTPSGNGNSSGDSNRNVPLEVLLSDVPMPGWFSIGFKKDVPKHACYVGQWGDRYAWVTDEGMPQLARFTSTVLFVIKLKPGEAQNGKSSLAVTGSQ
jgi:hypothetical protein